MSNLQDLADLPLLEIWGEDVRARRVQGERITLAIVELAPNAVVPEHRHAAEPLGRVIRGSTRAAPPRTPPRSWPTAVAWWPRSTPTRSSTTAPAGPPSRSSTAGRGASSGRS